MRWTIVSAGLSVRLPSFGETSQHCSDSQNVLPRRKNLGLQIVNPVASVLGSPVIHTRRTYVRGVTGFRA